MAALPGRLIPSVSARQAIVLAVPITAHVPAGTVRVSSTSPIFASLVRSGERRVGEKCRTRGGPDHLKKKKQSDDANIDGHNIHALKDLVDENADDAE